MGQYWYLGGGGAIVWPDVEWHWKEAMLNPRGNSCDLFSRSNGSL